MGGRIVVNFLICIGFDEFHKDEKIVKLLLETFKDYNVAINSPYTGSLVPIKYYMKDARVKSVMIEVNKKLYLEDDNKTLNKEFMELRFKCLGRFFTDRF